MDIRTFEGASMREAIQAVKKELGKDAVILKTLGDDREGKKYFKVTAVKPGSEERSRLERSRSDELPGIGDELNKLRSEIAKISRDIASRRDIYSLNADMDEVRSLLMEHFKKNQENQLYGRLGGQLDPMIKKVQMAGVDHLHVIKMIEDIEYRLKKRERSIDNKSDPMREEVIRWLAKKIKIFRRWERSPVVDHSIHVVVGGSGVGKTSVAAKIAAQSHLAGLKVGLVSLGDKILGGSEQLRICAKVIGVPFESCLVATDVWKILKKYEDYDFIIVDTMAINPRFPERIDEIKSLDRDGHEIDYHLVLSMNDRFNQMDRTVRAFSRVGISSLIFSKMDESWSYGEMINLSLKWNIPLSFFAVGEDIPGGLERATRETVIQRIIGKELVKER